MKIIRKCASNWNDFPTFSPQVSDSSQEISKWHNQTWQGWVNVEQGSTNTLNPYSNFNNFKISKYNIYRDFDKEILAWNTSSGAVVILSPEEYEIITSNLKCLEKHINKKRTIVATELIRLGFIVGCEEVEHFKLNYIRSQLSTQSPKVKNFIVLPTTACNGRCFYCFADSDTSKCKTMDSATVDQVVNFICRMSDSDDEIVLRWFGGEPLLSMNIIERIITGIRKLKNTGFRFFSIITSNGSLLNEQVIIKAKNNWNLKKFHLTIDGYKNEHQLRKGYSKLNSGGYNHVIKNISLLLKHGIYTIVRINLDKNNISGLRKILDDLEKFKDNPLFFIHATNLQPINRNDNIDSFFCEDELETFYFSIYDTLFKRGFYRNIEILLPNRLNSLCTAAMPNYYLINPDGDIFKCDKEEHVKENAIGNCSHGIIQNKNLLKWIDTSLHNNCTNCVFLPICQGGCKYYRYNSDKCDVSPCIKLKNTIDTNLVLAYKYFHNNSF